MFFEAERLTQHDLPTTDQLRRLASIGVKSAVARENFRDLRQHDNTHYYCDELNFRVGEAHDEHDVFLPYQVRHSLAVRIGVRQATRETPKTWTLKFSDTYSAKPRTPDSTWRTERSVYRFEWTRHQVLMADRAFRLLGFEAERDEDIEYYLDHFSLRDDDAALLEVEDDIRAITRDDCEELINDTTEYFRVVDAATMSRMIQ